MKYIQLASFIYPDQRMCSISQPVRLDKNKNIRVLRPFSFSARNPARKPPMMFAPSAGCVHCDTATWIPSVFYNFDNDSAFRLQIF